MTNKVWTREEIDTMLKTSNKALLRGILAIYDYQTTDEKAIQETKDHNGVGFSGVDGNFMSSLAEQILGGRNLSEKQLAIARNKMLKYSGQLVRIANNR